MWNVFMPLTATSGYQAILCASLGNIVENSGDQIFYDEEMRKKQAKIFSVMHMHFLTTHPCVSDAVPIWICQTGDSDEQ